MTEHSSQHGEGRPEDAERKPENQSGEVGAEGGSPASEDASVPFSPSKDDDSALGDTDQHSSG